MARAIEAAQQLVRKHPYAAAAWGELGMVLHAHGYCKEGVVGYAQAEEFDAGDPRWPYLQGACWGDRDTEKAVPCYQRAIERCGPEPVPRLALGETLLELGRLDEAEEQFRQVAEADPANGRAYLGLGRVAHGRGDLKTSLEHLERSVAGTHKAPAAYTLLAEVDHRLGDRTKAEKARRQAPRVPNQPWPDPYLEQVGARAVGLFAMAVRATALLRQGREEEALHLFRELVKAYPDSSKVRAGLGRILVLRKEAPAAEKELREASRLEPGLIDAHYYLGVALFLQDQHDEAAASFRKAIELQPQYAAAHYDLGQCLIRLGDRTGALAAFRDAARCKPGYASAHKNLGILLAEAKQDAEALVHLEQAATLNPSDQATKKLLEEVRQRSGKNGPP